MKIKNKISAKLLGSAFLLSTLFFASCEKEQGITPNSTQNSSELDTHESNVLSDSITKLSVSITDVSSSAYNIEKALPSGYVKDGSVDYTTYLQSAINKYSELVFPAFPIMVNDNGLKIPSNRKIYFLDGSELRLKPSSKSSYTILSMRNVSNVTLISPTIKGDKASHIGTKGEWGMGIGIRGSQNITVKGAVINDCWGDAIYIDNYNGAISKNVVLTHIKAKNNRRSGMSIISVDGLSVEESYFGYTSGAAPMVGINFEPDNSSSEFKNIKLKNIRTEYNEGFGIQIAISNMYGGANKKVSFDFENFMDKGSNIGFKVACYTSLRKGNETIAGNINMHIPFWRLNTERALKTNFDENNLKISISRPKVTLMNGQYLSGEPAKEYRLKKGNINPKAVENKLVSFINR